MSTRVYRVFAKKREIARRNAFIANDHRSYGTPFVLYSIFSICLFAFLLKGHCLTQSSTATANYLINPKSSVTICKCEGTKVPNPYANEATYIQMKHQQSVHAFLNWDAYCAVSNHRWSINIWSHSICCLYVFVKSTHKVHVHLLPIKHVHLDWHNQQIAETLNLWPKLMCFYWAPLIVRRKMCSRSRPVGVFDL